MGKRLKGTFIGEIVLTLDYEERPETPLDEVKKIFRDGDLLERLIKLIIKTHMTDFDCEVYKKSASWLVSENDHGKV